MPPLAVWHPPHGFIKRSFAVGGVDLGLQLGGDFVHTGSAQGLKSCMFFCPGEDWGFVCLCSSTKLDKINDVYKIYYQTINLLYEQFIKPYNN